MKSSQTLCPRSKSAASLLLSCAMSTPWPYRPYYPPFRAALHARPAGAPSLRLRARRPGPPRPQHPGRDAPPLAVEQPLARR